jgi:hypothetical protein
VSSGRRPIVVGMCKWTAAKVDLNELNLLDRLAHYAGADDSVRRVIFSRSGFTSRLTAYSEHDDRLALLTPADIYARHA